MGRLLKFFLVLIFPIVSYGESGLDWQIEEVKLPTNVKIEESPNSDKDVLWLSPEDRVYIDKHPTNATDFTSYRNLSLADKTAFQKARRSIVLALTKLSLKNRLRSVSIVKGNKAAQVTPTLRSLELSNLVLVDPIAGALDLNDPNVTTYRNKTSKLKAFLRMMNEAVILSTFKSIKQHSENRTYIRKYSNEVGIQIVFKAEFQFGMGDVNITKNLPITLNIGYRKDTGEVLISVEQRSERMDAGTAFSAGLKVELKKYSKVNVPEDIADNFSNVGTTWYPPSIPMLSFVGDSSPVRNAAGIVFGINLADLIPGLYFINTSNNYSDRKIYSKSIKIPNVKGWISKLVTSIKNFNTSSTGSALMCNEYLR